MYEKFFRVRRELEERQKNAKSSSYRKVQEPRKTLKFVSKHDLHKHIWIRKPPLHTSAMVLPTKYFVYSKMCVKTNVRCCCNFECLWCVFIARAFVLVTSSIITRIFNLQKLFFILVSNTPKKIIRNCHHKKIKILLIP